MFDINFRMEKLIPADDKALQYMGRIDHSNEKEPLFVFACSSVRVISTGNSIKAVIKNKHGYFNNYIGAIIDGKQYKYLLPEDNDIHTITLAEHLPDGEHDVLLFKRMDACHHFSFIGFLVDEDAKIKMPSPLPTRKIEVFGDSVSAGEVSEAVEYVGLADPEHSGEFSNSYFSYSWLTARKLNAQIHDVAQGGAALLDGTGYFMAPRYRGMKSIYDKQTYNLDLGEDTLWDFSKYITDVVIVAIGQNDNYPEDYMSEDYNCEKSKAWRVEYRHFILSLQEKYPNAVFVLTTTILNHNDSWDRAIDDVVTDLNDKNIHHFLYTKNGCGTHGHIRIPEAQKMSDELSEFIEQIAWR